MIPLRSESAFTHVTYPGWMTDALCAQIGAAPWFPEDGQNSRLAKRLCATCPVLTECGDYAATMRDQPEGVWAGKTRRERLRLRREAS